jgi:general transcription factor 3C polypeptide 6
MSARAARAERRSERRSSHGRPTATRGSPKRDTVKTEDCDWETDEEEMVHVQLSGIFQSELLGAAQAQAKFVGIETEQPIVQIGGQVFVGKYEDVAGTAVFLRQEQQEPGPEKEDDFARPHPAEFVCQTHKRLVLRRVFLREKGDPMREMTCASEQM